MSAQVAIAAAQFDATAKSVTEAARSQFLETAAQSASDFNVKHERKERAGWE